jgi:Uma2 family endonuclease
MTTKAQLLTIADWDAMPADDGYRYEIIEGELFVSCSPGLTHERVLINLILLLGNFLEENPIAEVVGNVGVILSNVSGVIPDLVIFLNEQRDSIIMDDRLHGPPSLVIEVLSPGSTNVRRDRVSKLQLYGKHRVPEYWIVDPKKMSLERYVSQDPSMVLLETLSNEDSLSTPVLPGFSCRLSQIFRRISKT